MANQDKVEIFFVIDTAGSKLRYIGARVKPSADKPQEWCVVDVPNEIYRSPHLRGKKSKPEGLFPLFAWVGLGLPPIAKTEAKDEINRIVRNSLSCRDRWIRREKKYCEGKKSLLYHKMRCFHLQHRFLFETFRRFHSIKLSKTSPLEACDIHICDLAAIKKHIRVKDDKAFANRLSTIDPGKLEACVLDQRSLYRAMADFSGVSEIKTREISSALEPLREMAKRFATKLPVIQFEYIVHLSSEDSDGLYEHLCKSPFSEGIPLTEVAHPLTQNITLTPGLRLRILGRPGTGKSVALYQICQRNPGWHILLIKPILPANELVELQWFCRLHRSEPVALVFEDFHRSLSAEGTSFLLTALTWLDANCPDAAVIVTYRGTEALEVSQHIGSEEWYLRGFRNEVWLDPAPKGFIRQVLRLSAKTFNVEVTERLFDKWAQWIEKSDNTPLYCAESAHTWKGMTVSEPFFEISPPRSSVERWKRLFEDLPRKPEPARSLGPHVLRTLAFLHLVGDSSPFDLARVFSFLRLVLGDVEGLAFSNCIEALQASCWLLREEALIYIHDVQLAPPVVGLVENCKTTPFFHQYAEAAETFAMRLPSNEAATMLCLIASLWIEYDSWERGEKTADAALRLSPNHARALFQRGLARFTQKRWEPGMADLLAAAYASSAKQVPWGVLTVFSERLMGKESDELIDSLRDSFCFDDWIHLALFGYLGTGNFEAAVALAKEYAQLNEDSHFSQLILSETLLRSGMAQDALAVADKILKLDPHSVVAWRIKGSAYLIMGKYQEAKKVCAQVSRCFPPSYAVRRLAAETSLWETCLASGEAKLDAARRALHLAEWCLYVIPSDPDALVLRGLALLGLGRMAEAEKSLSEASKDTAAIEPCLRIAAKRALYRIAHEKARSGGSPRHEPVVYLLPNEVLFYCRLFRKEIGAPSWIEARAILSLGRVEHAGQSLKAIFLRESNEGDDSDSDKAWAKLAEILYRFAVPIEVLFPSAKAERPSARKGTKDKHSELNVGLVIRGLLKGDGCESEYSIRPAPPKASRGKFVYDGIDDVAVTCISDSARVANIDLAGELHFLWASWCWKRGRRLPLQGLLPVWLLSKLPKRACPERHVWFSLGVACVALAFRGEDPIWESHVRDLLKFRWHKVCRAAECDDAMAASLAALIDHVAKVSGKKSPVSRELAIRGRALLNSCSDSGPLGVCVLSDLWRRLNNEMPPESAPN